VKRSFIFSLSTAIKASSLEEVTKKSECFAAQASRLASQNNASSVSLTVGEIQEPDDVVQQGYLVPFQGELVQNVGVFTAASAIRKMKIELYFAATLQAIKIRSIQGAFI
jgi:hypothetical protein